MRQAATTYAFGQTPDAKNREKDDFYPTPPEGTEALLRVERFEGDIWEPACGDGSMSKVFKAHGYTVHSSDLVDRGYGETRVDFLMEYEKRAPNIITNPPFKMAEEFVYHALDLAEGKVAMLCRLAFLESQARHKMFTTTPLRKVWVFSERLGMVRGGEKALRGGGSMIAFAWFVWDKNYAGEPTIGWLKGEAA